MTLIELLGSNLEADTAWGDWRAEVPKGSVVVLAIASNGDRRYFQVPASEYSPSMRIDPAKYPEVAALPALRTKRAPVSPSTSTSAISGLRPWSEIIGKLNGLSVIRSESIANNGR